MTSFLEYFDHGWSSLSGTVAPQPNVPRGSRAKRATALLSAALTALLLSVAAPTFAAAKIIRIEVNGMVCAFCSAAIEKKLKALPETQAIYVNLARKVVALELKDGKSVSLDAVKAQVIDAGYEVRSIAETLETLAQIKAAAK